MPPSIVAILQHSVLGRGCAPSELLSLATGGPTRALASGEALFEAGVAADAAYVLLEGALEVIAPDGTWLAREGEPGALVGEQSLLPGADGVRTAAVRAVGPARVLRVDAAAFSAMLRARPEGERSVEDAAAERTRNRAGRLSEAFRHLLERGQTRSFADGAVVFREGDAADGLHMVLAGHAEVVVEWDGVSRPLTVVHPGQCFGEIASLRGIPRTATVLARGGLRTAFVPVSEARALQAELPALGAFLDSLLRSHDLPRRGRLHQRSVFVEGRACVETRYALDDGRSLEAVRDPAGAYRLRTAGAVVARRLTLAPGTEVCFDAEHRVVGLDDAGAYEDVAGLQSLALDGAPLSVRQRRGLRAAAREAAEQAPDALLCRCLGLSRATLQSAIDTGADTPAALQAATGCGTVCGGCMKQAVPRMLPEDAAPVAPPPAKRSWFRAVFGGLLAG